MLCLTRRKFERKYKFKGLDDNVLQYNGFVQKYENPKLLCNFLFFICQFCRSEILHDSKHGIFGKKLTRKSLVRVLELAYDTTWFFFPFFFSDKGSGSNVFFSKQISSFYYCCLVEPVFIIYNSTKHKKPVWIAYFLAIFIIFVLESD